MEYFITIIVVVLITILQFRSFFQTRRKRKHFEMIFSENISDELVILKEDGVQISYKRLSQLINSEKDIKDLIQKIEKERDEYIQKLSLEKQDIERYEEIQKEVLKLDKQLKKHNKELENINQRRDDFKLSNETFSEIISAVNRYLDKNKNAVIDFNLIRDIIDRNCDVVEEEIHAQLPFPIYYGLMGTMSGIIFGAASLVFSGSLDHLLTPFPNPANLPLDSNAYKCAYEAYNKIATEGILSLFGGVAIATISSIIGIILNVISTNSGKESKTIVESKKHKFISWLQAELLPKISNDFSSALIKLGGDLTSFNSTFSQNANLLKNTISKIGSVTSAQADLLESINRLDVKRIATANIKVCEKLEICTSELDKLADNLNTIENKIRSVGGFFEQGINEYERRNTYIQDASAKVDIAVNNGHEELAKTTHKVYEQYRDLLNSLYLQMQTTTENLSKKYSDDAEKLYNVLTNKLNDIKCIEDELKNLVAVKDTINSLDKSTIAQNKKIDSLVSAIYELAQAKVSGGSTRVEMKLPKLYKILIIVSTSILSCSALFFIVLRVLQFFSIL